ncbi:hypothetical protein FOXB_13537 [Fusarium oxysporum f. sp. conglutinans Fo5176]|uniref:Uncharacterized protein n=1 Tax=Fusarium oxysporum (strain Fo5176) TaxID=660025 RepID=F9G4F5_FUSOF|nr:hypothetical protein FOXB_13537 [Fusarium oxysporum f. sp. conglutinans Fo5176]
MGLHVRKVINRAC